MSIHIRWSFHTYAGCVDIPSVAFLILCCVAISLTPWWSFVIYNNPPFAYEPLKSLSQMFYTLMVIHNNPLFVYEPLKSLSQMFSRGVLGWSSVQICTWAPQMFFRGVLEWSSVQLCTWAPAFTPLSFLVGFWLVWAIVWSPFFCARAPAVTNRHSLVGIWLVSNCWEPFFYA